MTLTMVEMELRTLSASKAPLRSDLKAPHLYTMVTSVSHTMPAWSLRKAVKTTVEMELKTIQENVCYALGPISLAHVSNVLILCLIRLVWSDYVYHWFAWYPYWTFPLSQYLAALDPLTCPGSPSYLGLCSHSRAPPSAHLPLHQFWHMWVISTAITKISSVAYSVPYQASVSPCLACWRIASASCDSIFLWLSPSCIYSVCIRPELLQTWSPCNPRTTNHLLELRSPALPKSSFTSLSLCLRLSLKSVIWSNYST